jgi:hypothetical protein
VQVAEAARAAHGEAEPYQVVVEVDADSLATGRGTRCELREGPVLASETARHIACDAPVATVTTRGGEVADASARTRRVPPRMRRALEARDQTCRWPGCGARRFRHAHHVIHWVRGGETRLSNLVLVCRFHRRLLHEGGYCLVLTATGEARFFRPDGFEIPPVGVTPGHSPSRAGPGGFTSPPGPASPAGRATGSTSAWRWRCCASGTAGQTPKTIANKWRPAPRRTTPPEERRPREQH